MLATALLEIEFEPSDRRVQDRQLVEAGDETARPRPRARMGHGPFFLMQEVFVLKILVFVPIQLQQPFWYSTNNTMHTLERTKVLRVSALVIKTKDTR